jgi:L-2-hydroxyglutarate oxidase LhgO
MTKRCDVVIIGAGIVGLATAYQLKKKRSELSIVVLEKESGVAKHQTGHNSGVVHTGIYYKPGSLKAENCLRGRQELLKFCDEHGIRYQKVGKIVVATDENELPQLEEIGRRGAANGISGVKMISAEEAKEIEPHVSCIKALWVPECAIIHFPDVAQKISELLEKAGVEIVFNSEVVAIDETRVITKTGDYLAGTIISCTGLHSDRIAKLGLGKIPYKIIPFRGEYFKLKKEARDLVKGLIYPVPNPQFPFLGVHLTRMVSGDVEAGPNAVLALAREGYKKTSFNPKDALDTAVYPGFWKMALRYWKEGSYELYRSLNRRAFLKDLQKLVPSLKDSDLVPGGSGVRAQVVLPSGKLLDDFAILQEKNMIYVLNAPSPAATASFSIGETIAGRVVGC